MKTILRAYCFNTNTPEGAAQWDELKARLESRPGATRCFETHGGNSHYLPDLDGAEVEIEPKHLFFDQWNTAPIAGDTSTIGRRLFDWAKDYESHIGAPRGIARGHYLELTPEMVAARQNTAKCCYCGAQAPAGAAVFHKGCLDSEYLKETDLYLLRFVRICDDKPRREFPPLTPEERAELVSEYTAAQTGATSERARKRLEKARRDVETKYLATITNATTERDGFRFLLAHNFPLDNVIFYSHTGRFGFGWRTPVSGEVKSRLLDILCEFPFDYDIKAVDPVDGSVMAVGS